MHKRTESMEPDPRSDAVANEVRAWLGRTRHTQTELAEVLGIAKSGATRRMKGELAFTITELLAVADWLDVTLEDLLGPSVLRARRSPRSDMVTAGASGEEGWALRGSNPRPMD